MGFSRCQLPLANSPQVDYPALTGSTGLELTWMDAFIGREQGSIGDNIGAGRL